ncbi:MAG: phosphoribosylformylglycinamidine synthase I [Candidatus Hydrothermarchaeaceae archaeon]
MKADSADYEDIRICVLRAPGTNCDGETRQAIIELGASADVVRIDRLSELAGYHGLIIPGGFSYGDHIRSGAIMGKLMVSRFGDLIRGFAEEGKPILGICNGFQVLAEAGLLPGFEYGDVEMALGRNNSSHFECRWTHLKMENRGKAIFAKYMPGLVRMPIAHGEGKVIFPPGKEEEYLEKLMEGDQIVLRYAKSDGENAGGMYPHNPNGSIGDIAGLCNPAGNVIGMMPHPERAFYGYTYPDWTRGDGVGYGDGYWVFRNMLEYATRF